MNVTNVGNPSLESQPYMPIRGSIQKRNPVNVPSVGNPAALSQPLFVHRVSRSRKKPHECWECGTTFCVRSDVTETSAHSHRFEILYP